MTNNIAESAEIRAELARAGETQTTLAERLGVSQVWVSRRLTGGVSINITELQAIARALGVPTADLLPRE